MQSNNTVELAIVSAVVSRYVTRQFVSLFDVLSCSAVMAVQSLSNVLSCSAVMAAGDTGAP